MEKEKNQVISFVVWFIYIEFTIIRYLLGMEANEWRFSKVKIGTYPSQTFPVAEGLENTWEAISI